MIRKLIISSMLMILFIYISAGPASAESGTAPLLNDSLTVNISDGQSGGALLDDNVYTYLYLKGDTTIIINQPEGISGLYIIWNKVPGKWTYTLDGVSNNAGQNGYLHEYIKLNKATAEVKINSPSEGAQISDIYCFGEGSLPDWVQVWQPPCDKADLLLLPTHSDDEQLFFAGVLPYYAGELNLSVQVVYMTNHWDTVRRPHEQLNGLWTVGVRSYPVVGPFPDDAASLGSKAETVETVFKRALSVYDEEAIKEFQVETIRRFRPLVIIGHDFAGEYRHGAHILNAYTLKEALELSGNAAYYPSSAQKYGVWDVPKTYIHLYEENQIVMNWDVPLNNFNGLTAFEVTKLGYACHLSQQRTWFTSWLNQAKAADITAYSPCLYGLYRSTVGLDSGKADFFENIITYEKQAELINDNKSHLLAQEQRAAELTESSLSKVKTQTLQLRQEEAIRQAEEAQRRLEEEAQRLDEKAKELSQRLMKIQILKAAAFLVIVIIITGLVLLLRRRKR
jgi:LmbE family N-acetylglucosaminyl deacetylase